MCFCVSQARKKFDHNLDVYLVLHQLKHKLDKQKSGLCFNISCIFFLFEDNKVESRGSFGPSPTSGRGCRHLAEKRHEPGLC